MREMLGDALLGATEIMAEYFVYKGFINISLVVILFSIVGPSTPALAAGYGAMMCVSLGFTLVVAVCTNGYISALMLLWFSFWLVWSPFIGIGA